MKVKIQEQVTREKNQTGITRVSEVRKFLEEKGELNLYDLKKNFEDTFYEIQIKSRDQLELRLLNKNRKKLFTIICQFQENQENLIINPQGLIFEKEKKEE